ncbi:MAG: sulfotransferase, partial [Sphingobacteriales bacterium]
MLPFTFLICTERSGSNLITKLFDSHPAFCGPSPTHLFRILTRNRIKYGNLENAENWKILCEDMAGLLEAKLGQWQRKFTKEELAENVTERKLSALLRYIFEEETAANGKKRAFVKENHAWAFLPFLLANFPEAKFVYLVRDPRDMALSYKKTLAQKAGISEAVAIWQQDQQASISAYLQLKEAGKIYLLTYEQLVEKPAETLTEICSFLGENFEEQMLGFHQNNLTKENATPLQAWN